MVTPFERALIGELEGSHGDRFHVCDNNHREGYTTLRGTTREAFPDFKLEATSPLAGGHVPLKYYGVGEHDHGRDPYMDAHSVALSAGVDQVFIALDNLIEPIVDVRSTPS